MLELIIFVASSIQDPAKDIESIDHAESERIRTMASVAPAVCAVIPIESHGGGFGVIIDPLGFLLTHFHVVARGVDPLLSTRGPAGPTRVHG
jgi:hypothetical protein